MTGGRDVGAEGQKKTITANLCAGCRDMNTGDNPEKWHFCKAVNEMVKPVVLSFPKGEKCRDKLCSYRIAAKRKKTA